MSSLFEKLYETGSKMFNAPATFSDWVYNTHDLPVRISSTTSAPKETERHYRKSRVYEDITPLVKCRHCGQWAAVFTACAHCGAPVDPE